MLATFDPIAPATYPPPDGWQWSGKLHLRWDGTLLRDPGGGADLEAIGDIADDMTEYRLADSEVADFERLIGGTR